MNFAAWIVILLFAANILSSSAHQDSEMLRNRDFLISSNKLELSHPQEDHDFGRRKVEASDNINFGEKAQRGRGSYGGANRVHRRPGNKSAAFLYKPSFLISYIIIGYGFFIFLAFAS